MGAVSLSLSLSIYIYIYTHRLIDIQETCEGRIARHEMSRRNIEVVEMPVEGEHRIDLNARNIETTEMATASKEDSRRANYIGCCVKTW